MVIANELIRAIREQRIVPLVGAGVSVSVKPGLFPTWRQLLIALADDLDSEACNTEADRVRRLIQGDRYIQAAEVGLGALGAYRFNRFLRERFRKQRPSELDLALPRAIWALGASLVITTNYDAVMRWGAPLTAGGTPCEVQVVANDQAEELALLHEATSEWPWLWHLHGTIERLGTLILAGSDYRRLYGGDQHSRSERYERAVFELHTRLATQSFLYVGFSLGDPYVLQQIAEVLALTRGKNAPSFALMKRGEADSASLWSNYNIQLIEYEDHGAPLVALLSEIAERARPEARAARRELSTPAAAMSAAPAQQPMATRAPGPAPDASWPARFTMARPMLEQAYTRDLMRERRLLVLSPQRGGAPTMARAVARAGFGERVIWLDPPQVPGCTQAEYFAALSGDGFVTGFVELKSWLTDRIVELRGEQSGEHLIVVEHDKGPQDHLRTLGNVLRALLDETPHICMLIAGGAGCAWLRTSAPLFSLFAGAPAQHVPGFEVAEVCEYLDRAGWPETDLGTIVHSATGGLPGLVAEVAAAGPVGLTAGAYERISERLSRSASVRGALAARLIEDDHACDAGELAAERHARTVLRELVAGRPVRRLGDVEDRLEHAEVRLYYDGLVMAEASGATVFRCEAARRAAERALIHEPG